MSTTLTTTGHPPPTRFEVVMAMAAASSTYSSSTTFGNLTTASTLFGSTTTASSINFYQGNNTFDNFKFWKERKFNFICTSTQPLKNLIDNIHWPRFLRALFLRHFFYAKILLFNKFQDTLFLRQVGVKEMWVHCSKNRHFFYATFFLHQNFFWVTLA